MVEKRKLFSYFLFFSKIAPRWGQIGQSYLALGRAKLRKSSKVEFIGANSDFGGVEMVPVPPVLAQIVQNEPWWAKLALEKLGPIWLLGSIWLFSFYSVGKRSHNCKYWKSIVRKNLVYKTRYLKPQKFISLSTIKPAREEGLLKINFYRNQSNDQYILFAIFLSKSSFAFWELARFIYSSMFFRLIYGQCEKANLYTAWK